MIKTPEYRAYYNAKTRCECRFHSSYESYGGRGITFDFENFSQFLTCVGPKPTPEHSLERIDNSSGYKPGNVRWATRKEQCQNRRSRRDGFRDKISPDDVRSLIAQGFWQTDIAWAFGVSDATISNVLLRKGGYANARTTE